MQNTTKINWEVLTKDGVNFRIHAEVGTRSYMHRQDLSHSMAHTLIHILASQIRREKDFNLAAFSCFDWAAA